MQLSIFSSVELPVSLSASPDSEKDLMTRAVTSRLPILRWLHDIAPAGWFGRTSPVFCPTEGGELLPPSSQGWGNSGMGSPTEFLTLNMSEWTALPAQFPSDEGVSSLSDVLETGDVLQRYFLSQKACSGILRRAAKRGKQLPGLLRRALENVAASKN